MGGIITSPTTPRELSNGQGQWVWKARYRTYGALALQEEAAEEQNPAACKLRFQGQYWDEESGLHYNLNRYYDPQTGQFISQDPIGLAGGLNLYQYAPNPVTWVDPWGLTCKEGGKSLSLPPPRYAEPWMPSTSLVSEPAPKGGLMVEMAMSPGQTRPGGWATTDHIPDINYVRQRLAVTPEFKPEVGSVQKFLIPEGVQLQKGVVGPQVFEGVAFPGGGSQVQILNFTDRAKLIPVGGPRPIQ